MTHWYEDPRMLAAGNARGVDGGDPDAMPISPVAPDGTRPQMVSNLDGDLDAAAAVMGVDVADLVRLRRAIGTTHRRRATRPGWLARWFGRAR